MQQLQRILRWFVLIFLALSAMLVSAQSARDLSLAGVTMPGEADMFSNPALSHQGFSSGTTTIPVPFGVFGIISSLSSEDVDLLYVLDAALHLESYLLNPARGDIDIGFETYVDENGRSRLGLYIDTGDVPGFVQSLSRGVAQSLDVPISFRVSGQTFAVHPFVTSYVQFKPSGSLGRTISVGLDRVRLNLVAGVSADWLYAGEVALTPEHPSGAKRYAGFRLAPFLGLANIDVDIKGSDLTLTQGEASFRVDAASFSSLITADGLGGGLITDWDVVDVLPFEQGNLTLGVSVRNLSLSYWRGHATDLVGEGSSENSEEATLDFIEEDARRFFFAPHLSILLHGAYTRELSDAIGLTVATDLSFDVFTETPAAALGAEGTLSPAFSDELALRAGVGWERGLKWGLGTGATWGWFGLDAALHSYQSPASLRSTYGLALSSRFKF